MAEGGTISTQCCGNSAENASASLRTLHFGLWWHHCKHTLPFFFFVSFMNKDKGLIVFGDQASVNMQEMALMQAGRGTKKG